MKVLILLACLTGALAFTINDVSDDVVPIQETVEWQAAFPELANRYLEEKALESSDSNRNSRIWGGTQAPAGLLNYHVGILILLSRQGHCGGSLISSTFVLTAAQCFPGPGIPHSVIEAGSHDRDHMNEFANAVETIIHPDFAASSDNDIAVIRMHRAIISIAPIRLPNRRQAHLFFENQQARKSGFGARGGGESVPVQVLHMGFAQIITQLSCRLSFPSSSSDRTVCTDGSSVNICNGDFGGPLTITAADGRTTQIGIASFNSILGCTRGSPGGFTRIGFFLDWIGSNTNVVIQDDF